MFFVFRAVTGVKGESKRLRSMAAYVYIFHPLVIIGVRFADKLAKLEGAAAENNLILYAAVCVISTGISWAVCLWREKAIKLRKHR